MWSMPPRRTPHSTRTAAATEPTGRRPAAGAIAPSRRTQRCIRPRTAARHAGVAADPTVVDAVHAATAQPAFDPTRRRGHSPKPAYSTLHSTPNRRPPRWRRCGPHGRRCGPCRHGAPRTLDPTRRRSHSPKPAYSTLHSTPNRRPPRWRRCGPHGRRCGPSRRNAPAFDPTRRRHDREAGLVREPRSPRSSRPPSRSRRNHHAAAAHPPACYRGATPGSARSSSVTLSCSLGSVRATTPTQGTQSLGL